jgi:tRNA(adenine34) deaminase
MLELGISNAIKRADRRPRPLGSDVGIDVYGEHPAIGGRYPCCLTESDERFMKEALALARQGLDGGETPIGAAVVIDDEVVASASWKYAPDALLDHAENVALRTAEKDRRVHESRRRATLYTTLEPCLMCMGAAMSFGVARIVFALEAPFDGASTVTKEWQPELGYPPVGYQVFSLPEVVGGVCREASLELVQTYVERNPHVEWLKVMLPGFSYPTTTP